MREIRAAKSLDFEREANLSKHLPITSSRNPSEVDYTSEPVSSFSNNLRVHNGRPTPPKKPLRLSLHRAQSLQAMESSSSVAIMDLEKKRATKRSHRGQHHQHNEGNSFKQLIEKTSVTILYIFRTITITAIITRGN